MGGTFVGRDAELRHLRESHQSAARGEGSLVVVSGVAGIGKSTLIREFLANETVGDVLSAAGDEQQQAPLAVWRSVLSQARRRGLLADWSLDGEQSDDMHGLAEAVLEAVVAHVELTDKSEPARPVVLVIENLQWVDPASQRLLAHLGTLCSTERILIIAALRTGFESDGEARLSPTLDLVIDDQLALGGLTESDLVAVVARRYPDLDERRLTSAAAHLHELAGGNPLAGDGILNALERVHGPAAPDHLGELGVESVRMADQLMEAIETALEPLSPDQREVLGVGVIAGSMQLFDIAALTGRSADEVGEALAIAGACGVLDLTVTPPVPVHPLMSAGLVRAVSPQVGARVHAKLCQRYADAAGEHLSEAVRHGRLSGGLIRPAVLAELAERAGHYAFDELAYEDADRLLGLADELSAGQPQRVQNQRTERLLKRALANERLGDLERAHELYRQAAVEAQAHGQDEQFATAAIGYAFPPTWRLGATRDALDLIASARAAGVSGTQEIKLASIQAMLEIRVPRIFTRGDEWSWLVYPEEAQPRAEDAVARARVTGDPPTLLLALLAWRWTHCAPQLLCERLAASREALKLAISVNDSSLLSESCVRLVGDAVEAGDRQLAVETLDLARWASARELDYRFIWRTRILSGLIASVDGDWEAFDREVYECERIAKRIELPGSVVVGTLQFGHRMIMERSGEFAESLRGPMNDIANSHPIAMSASALALAEFGDVDAARVLFDRAMSALNEESSFLVCISYAAKACAALGDKSRAEALLPLLTPWLDRVAVDRESVISLGPVGLCAEPVAELVGDKEVAARAHDLGTIAQARLKGLTSDSHPCGGDDSALAVEPLTEREHGILTLMAKGKTNREIAEDLLYSLATVRRDTISIYRKLRVQGRANAVAKASQLGVI